MGMLLQRHMGTQGGPFAGPFRDTPSRDRDSDILNLYRTRIPAQQINSSYRTREFLPGVFMPESGACLVNKTKTGQHCLAHKTKIR